MLGLLLAGVAQAKEFKNVQVPDEVKLEGESSTLRLNGVGMRTKFFFYIYIGAFIWLGDEPADEALKAAMLNVED